MKYLPCNNMRIFYAEPGCKHSTIRSSKGNYWRIFGSFYFGLYVMQQISIICQGLFRGQKAVEIWIQSSKYSQFLVPTFGAQWYTINGFFVHYFCQQVPNDQINSKFLKKPLCDNTESQKEGLATKNILPGVNDLFP